MYPKAVPLQEAVAFSMAQMKMKTAVLELVEGPVGHRLRKSILIFQAPSIPVFTTAEIAQVITLELYIPGAQLFKQLP